MSCKVGRRLRHTADVEATGRCDYDDRSLRAVARRAFARGGDLRLGTFEVTDSDANPVGAFGSFTIERSVVTDFEFTIGGVTYDEFDIHRQCFCRPEFIPPGGRVDDLAFSYDGPDGVWTIAWDFPGDNFGVFIDLEHFQFGGTLHSAGVGGPIEHDLVASVPEPGTAALLAVGLLALVRSRRTWTPTNARS